MSEFKTRLITASGAPTFGWKTHASAWLGISRPTLNRYLAHAESGELDKIPSAILEKTGITVSADVGRPTSYPTAHDMLICFAVGLVDLQAQVDDVGFAQAPYPPMLQRGFDVASALNLLTATHYPITLAHLLAVAATPVFDWCPDLEGPAADAFFAAVLMENNEVTRECLGVAELARQDPELVFYQTLIECCEEQDDGGQVLYEQWRRTVVERPVAEGYTELLARHPIFLANLDVAQRLIDTFYIRLSPIHAVSGKINLCPLSGTRLRRVGQKWMTELRDPVAQRYLEAHGPKTMDFTPDVLEVRRPARLFWTLPGWHEIAIAKEARNLGWEVDLWPNLDTVDLVLRKRGRSDRYAIDVKDHLSPIGLARSFKRFNGYKSHTRLVVIPDYLERLSPDYRKHFTRWRNAEGKSNADISLVSDLLENLKAST